MAVCIDGYTNAASDPSYSGSPGPWVESGGQQEPWPSSAAADGSGPVFFWQEMQEQQSDFNSGEPSVNSGGLLEWQNGGCVQTIAASWPIIPCAGDWRNTDGYQGHRSPTGGTRKRRFCTSYPGVGQCRRGQTCSFAHSREEICAPLLDAEEERQEPGALTDMFFMYKYKTRWCPIGVQHEWHTCVYAHNYQDARRPVSIGYGARLCPYWSKKDTGAEYSQRCPLGLRCPYSHGAKEQLYHPHYFKTVVCRDLKGKACPRQKLCAFYHTRHERRAAPPTDVDYTKPLEGEAIPSEWMAEFLSPPFATTPSPEHTGGCRGGAGQGTGCGGGSPRLAAGGGFNGGGKGGGSGGGGGRGGGRDRGELHDGSSPAANAAAAAAAASSTVACAGAAVGGGCGVGGAFPVMPADAGGQTAMSPDANKMRGGGQMMFFLMPCGAMMPQVNAQMTYPQGQMVLVPMEQMGRQQ